MDKLDKNIVSRKELTDEWKQRGITESLEYAKLTDLINKGTFDKTVKEHKEFKNLRDTDNLRDNMTPIELALTTLAETTTREITKTMNAKGYRDNSITARQCGRVGGDARKSIEKQLKESVVSRENYLSEKQKQRRLKDK